jgi:hypothetical protein
VAELDYRIEVVGVAEALRVLAKIDPELRKAVIKDMKGAAAPLEGAARSLVPARPLSNWGNWQTSRDGGPGPGRFVQAKAQKGIKVAFRSGGVKGYNKTTFPLLTLRQTDGPGAIYEMAGKKFPGKDAEGKGRGAAMVAKLNQSGAASRTLWPTVEAKMPLIEKELRAAINTMSDVIIAEILRTA